MNVLIELMLEQTLRFVSHGSQLEMKTGITNTAWTRYGEVNDMAVDLLSISSFLYTKTDAAADEDDESADKDE